MLLDVKSLTIIVKPSYLLDLITETFRIQKSWLGIAKVLVKILIFTRKADLPAQKQFNFYSTRLENLSWFKYQSDGNRIMLIDHLNGSVAKLPKKFDPYTYKLELEARRRVGSLTPDIISTSSQDGVIVESKLHLEPIQNVKTKYVSILKLLGRKLGPSKNIDLDVYLGGYPSTEFNSVVLDIANVNKVQKLSISLCHGDFWSGNIFQVSNNHPMIIDWEYCGYRIETFDGWFFVFSQWDFDKSALNLEFYRELSQQFSIVYQLDADLKRIKVLHMLHLFERYAAHLAHGKVAESLEMQFLAAELKSIIKELSK